MPANIWEELIFNRFLYPLVRWSRNLIQGRAVWLRKGNILDSVCASIALPGLFSSFNLDGKWLVDGGLVDPVPIALCRAMGAEVVIAVNLNGNIVGKHIKGREYDKYRQKSSTGENSDTWTRISNQIAAGLSEQKEAVLSQFLGENRNTPGFGPNAIGTIVVESLFPPVNLS